MNPNCVLLVPIHTQYIYGIPLCICREVISACTNGRNLPTGFHISYVGTHYAFPGPTVGVNQFHTHKSALMDKRSHFATVIDCAQLGDLGKFSKHLRLFIVIDNSHHLLSFVEVPEEPSPGRDIYQSFSILQCQGSISL